MDCHYYEYCYLGKHSIFGWFCFLSFFFHYKDMLSFIFM